jgi:lysozyme
MKTSKIGIDLIKHFESLHDGNLKEIGLQPKKDPVGIWTEGYGHAMRDSKGNFLKGKTTPKATIINELQAVAELAKDLESFELLVIRKLKRTVKQNEFDALVTFVYNCGVSQTLFEMVNSQNPLLKAWWVSHYITGQGNPNPLNGLIARRNAEAKLYFLE